MVYVNETVWAERPSDVLSYKMHMGKDVNGMVKMTKEGMLFSTPANIDAPVFAAIVADDEGYKFVSTYYVDGDANKLGFDGTLCITGLMKLSLLNLFNDERRNIAAKAYIDLYNFLSKHEEIDW
jgi:hypothetical protein